MYGKRRVCFHRRRGAGGLRCGGTSLLPPGRTRRQPVPKPPDAKEPHPCLGGFGKRKLKEGRLAIAYAPSQRVMISFLGKV